MNGIGSCAQCAKRSEFAGLFASHSQARRFACGFHFVFTAPVGCASFWQVRANGLDERSLRDGRYDGILHLVTAACGAEQHYSLENNEVRSESVEEAKDVRARGFHPGIFAFCFCARFCGGSRPFCSSPGVSAAVPWKVNSRVVAFPTSSLTGLCSNL